MLKHILVATDLSARSDRAIERGFALARETGAEITVLHVIDDELPTGLADQLRAEAESSLERICKGPTGQGVTKANPRVAFGRGFEEVLRHAEDTSADLVALGVHRNASGRSLFTGTTVERVIRHGETPVLVVRDRVEGPYGKILVGVDFSPYARRAAEFALGALPAAEVVLVHAYDVPFKGFITGRSARDEVSQRHQQQFDAMVEGEMKAFLASLPQNGGRLERVMREGTVREVVMNQVAQRKPDLLVIGTHGRTGVAHALLGSVAEDLLNAPPCDVLAVKAW
jgi:nucleotide-binding universal stress UspA family protein